MKHLQGFAELVRHKFSLGRGFEYGFLVSGFGFLGLGLCFALIGPIKGETALAIHHELYPKGLNRFLPDN